MNQLTYEEYKSKLLLKLKNNHTKNVLEMCKMTFFEDRHKNTVDFTKLIFQSIYMKDFQQVELRITVFRSL